MKKENLVEISKQALFPYIIFNKAIQYNDNIILYPIKMKNIIVFQQFQMALTLRKDSIFQEKQIIKMGYFDFIKYACRNEELSQKYKTPLLPYYYDFILGILKLSCGEDAKIECDMSTLSLSINGVQITNEIFDDIRKIIIIQNDIDFDFDEFMNIDTVRALEKARAFELKKNKEKSNI